MKLPDDMIIFRDNEVIRVLRRTKKYYEVYKIYSDGQCKFLYEIEACEAKALYDKYSEVYVRQ